jgi:hypothetical protein
MTNSIAMTTVPTSVEMTRSRLERRASVFRFLIRILIAGILLLAAVMKLRNGSQEQHGRGLIQSFGEAVLALWLISGVRPNLSVLIVFGTFAVFVVINGYEVVRETKSCGCFGTTAMAPGYTLAIDLGVMAILIASEVTAAFRVKRLATAAVFFAAVLALVYQTRKNSIAAVHGAGENTSVQIVDGWVGKPLPMLDAIDIGNQIGRGRWIVTFYRADCTACHEAIERMQSAYKPGGTPHALIEVSGASMANDLVSLPRGWIKGSLSGADGRTIATPITVTLQDGVVLPAAAPTTGGTASNFSSSNVATANQKRVSYVGQRISSSEWSADLGVVAPSSIATIKFNLTSPLPRNVRIRGVNAGCSCLTIPNPPTALSVGEETRVEVSFTAPKREMTDTATAELTTDAPELPPITLQITAHVRGESGSN